jgi:hypothetical protein
MFKYHLRQNSYDSHQSSPWWFAVIVRFDHVQTFDRMSIVRPSRSQSNVSLISADQDPVKEREPLVITSQILAFTVTHNKGSHNSSLSMRICPGKFKFEHQTQAGDWVMFWAFDNQADYERVLDKAIRAIKSTNGTSAGANDFNDGLKFVGRLNAPKRRRGVDPNTGVPRKEYQLTAVGFGEFDAKVYYNQSHVAKYSELVAGFVGQSADLQANIDSRIADGVPLTTAQHTKIWLEVFLGAGPGQASKGFDQRFASDASFVPDLEGSLLQTPNDVFLVPTTVGKLLSVPASGNSLRVHDLLNIFVGVQGVSYSGEVDRDTNSVQSYLGFVPADVGELSGAFRPQFTSFNNVSVWDLLSGYSNQPLNEMFVSLRVNAQGKVGPTFILRQNPLSSNLACEYLEAEGWPMTPFTEIPRWVVHEELVSDENLGPSDSLRINYVHVQGTDIPAETLVMMQTIQNALAPPMMDSADIKRNGLRPYIATLNSDVAGVIDKRRQLGTTYTQFMADILFDQHLKWTGSLQIKGIQEPVTVGDNLEWDDVVYHIESVTHSGHIDQGGRKTFETTFGLSNGVHVLSAEQDNPVMPYEYKSHLGHETTQETSSVARDLELDVKDFLDQESADRIFVEGPRAVGTSQNLSFTSRSNTRE